MLYAMVGEVEIIRLSRELSCQGIYLFYHRIDPLL